MKRSVHRAAALAIGWLVVSAFHLLVAQEPPPVTELETRPELLDPKQPRDEQQEDRITSGAHYARAWILLHRDDEAGALRHFQRAWRYCPSETPILQQVIGLASKLGRQEEAARYAVIAAERAPQEPELLVQLGSLLIEQGEPGRALAMFERAVQSRAEEPPTVQSIALGIEMGRLYFLQGALEPAALALAGVRKQLDTPELLTDRQRGQLLGKPDVLYGLMAETFLATGRLDDAVACFEKAAAGAEAGQLELQLARVAAARADFGEARRLLDVYLESKLRPAGTQPYELLARVIAEAADTPEEAERELLETLERLRQADPENVALHYFHAQRLLAGNQLEEAAKRYVDLVARAPDVNAYQALVEIYRRQEQADKLLDVLGQVVEKAGSLDVLEEQVKQLLAAEPLRTRLFELAAEAPADASSRLEAAALLAVQAGKLETADQLIGRALEAAGDDKPELLERLGLELLMADEFARAARLFQQALDEQPGPESEAVLRFYLAGALEFQGETDAAVAAAEQAAKLQPDRPQFQGRAAWLLFHAGRHDEAEARYRELLASLDAQHGSSDARLAAREARLVMSNLCVTQDRMPEAEEWLEQVLDEFPEDPGAHNDLGYLWADQGKHLQRALAMVQVAVTHEPDNAAYRDSLGWAFYRLGRYAEAVAELEKAAAAKDVDGVILDHLGDAYLQHNQRPQALAAWRRAVEALQEPDEADLREAVAAKIEKHQQEE